MADTQHRTGDAIIEKIDSEAVHAIMGATQAEEIVYGLLDDFKTGSPSIRVAIAKILLPYAIGLPKQQVDITSGDEPMKGLTIIGNIDTKDERLPVQAVPAPARLPRIA